MKIKSFRFDDHKENWHLKETFFNDLNLLVGVSGVGKTKILQALDFVRNVAGDNDYWLDGIEWTIIFTHSEQEYEWELKSALIDEEKSVFKPPSEIFYERLTVIENNNPTKLLIRTENESSLNGKKLHKLKKTESAITLLSEEDDIYPVYEAFTRFLFNETPQHVGVGISKVPEKVTMEPGKTLQAFFENTLIETSAVFKAYFLQKFFPVEFEEIKQYYFDIFPKVEDIKVEVTTKKSGGYLFSFAIKELDITTTNFIWHVSYFGTLNRCVNSTRGFCHCH